MFDWSSQSRAPFAGERRCSKSRGLSASVSFLPLPYSLFLILAPAKSRSFVFLCSPAPRRCLLRRLHCIEFNCCRFYNLSVGIVNELLHLRCIVLYSIVLHCIALYYIVLHCIALYCIVLHCIALYCIAVYGIVLHCIVLYCIVLN